MARLKLLLVVMIFVRFSFLTVVYSAEITTGRFVVAAEPVEEMRHGLEIKGVIPVVSFSDTEGKKFQTDINSAVVREYRSALAQVAGKQGKITFTYEIFIYENVVSVLMNIVSTAGTEVVRSFNFDPETREFVTISSVLGVNGLKLLNKELQNEVRTNIDKYNANTAEVTDNRTFYIDGKGVFYAVFDKYEIAYGSAGVVCFPLELSRIMELKIFSENYYTKAGYNIKMVQLKEVADTFGMTLEWDEKTFCIDIFSYTGEALAQICVGKTAYMKGKIWDSLEVAPELSEDGRTQVPISFLGDALGISYSFTGANKAVIVLTYYLEI